MPVHRKVFRIEERANAPAREHVTADEAVVALQRHEFMTEIKALRALIEPQASADREILERCRAQIVEAQAYKHELDLIYQAVKNTRREIGAPPATFDGSQAGRAGRELDAVVAATEKATFNVLQAAEDIDQHANTLSAGLKSEHEQMLAHDIRDRVQDIYQACNFQDIAGQRVAKVMEALTFIEIHMARLAEIWNRIDHFKPVVLDEAPPGDERFLNGPKLANAAGHASQDDIDALFGGA